MEELVWHLVLITVLNGEVRHHLPDIEPHPTMEECFASRDWYVEGLGRPIINYQVVCVAEEI